MTEDRLTPLQIQAFARHLRLEEKSEATISGTSGPSHAGWTGGRSAKG